MKALLKVYLFALALAALAASCTLPQPVRNYNRSVVVYVIDHSKDEVKTTAEAPNNVVTFPSVGDSTQGHTR